MNSRNRLFLTSIVFGLAPKFAGLFVVIISLPIIAHALTKEEYALFLLCMSVSAFFGSVFGVNLSTLSRSLTLQYLRGSKEGHAEERNVLGALLALSFTITLAMSILIGFLEGLNTLIKIAMFLGIIAGMSQYIDYVRISRRTDYISSIFNFVGAISMIIFIYIASNYGVYYITIIYLAVPVFVSLLNMSLYVVKEAGNLVPKFSWTYMISHLKATVPVGVNSLTDYMKIYGIPIFTYYLIDEASYTRTATLVIIVMRLVNPISLITRPLMPAYMDAQRSGDHVWLGLARKLVVLLASTCLLAGAALLFVAHASGVEALSNYLNLPISLPMLAQMLLLFTAQLFISLLLPIFLSSRSSMKFYSTVIFLSMLMAVSVGTLLAVAFNQDQFFLMMALSSSGSAFILMWHAFRFELQPKHAESVLLHE